MRLNEILSEASLGEIGAGEILLDMLREAFGYAPDAKLAVLSPEDHERLTALCRTWLATTSDQAERDALERILDALT